MTFQNPPIYLAFSPHFLNVLFWHFAGNKPEKKLPSFPFVCWPNYIWLVVSTPLKNISQLGRIIPYIMEKNVPNHQPASIHPFGCLTKIDEPQTTGFHPQTVSVLKNPSGTLRPSNQIKDSHGFSILKIQDYQRKPRFLFLWERWQILELPHQNVS